ncbi:MAG TPA: alkaline phosphatase family protein [Polyangiaceae bacterium]
MRRALLPLALLACSSSSAVTPPVPDAAPPGCGLDTVVTDPASAKRVACTFAAGATVADSLGLTAEGRGKLPIKHVIIVMQENRSFDHMLGGGKGWDGVSATFTNPDAKGDPVAPFHMTGATGCVPADPPHQGAAMLAGWNQGAMDGFVKSAAVSGSDGHFVMGYYDEADLPFYYFLARTFATSDRYFSSALAGTWGNRDYLYAGTSDGITDTGLGILTKRTVFDALDDAQVGWGVYTDGTPRQDSLGWTKAHAGVHDFNAFLQALADGSLPAVSFVDPGGTQDEHPAGDVHGGEVWGRRIVEAATQSALWKELAIFYTYDESGGLADHVAPPAACLASPDQTRFDHLGIRVPFYLISPWARLGYVSHQSHDHTSILRFVEALFDLPALTGRDANADALLDMFDFKCGRDLTAPTLPDAGPAHCP